MKPELTLTLAGLAEEQKMNCAIFRARLRIPGGEGGEIRSDVAGRLVIGTGNCWILDFTLQGPLAFKGSRRGMDVNGSGDLRNIHRFTYVK